MGADGRWRRRGITFGLGTALPVGFVVRWIRGVLVGAIASAEVGIERRCGAGG